jgi:hypothetical protein
MQKYRFIKSDLNKCTVTSQKSNFILPDKYRPHYDFIIHTRKKTQVSLCFAIFLYQNVKNTFFSLKEVTKNL